MTLTLSCDLNTKRRFRESRSAELRYLFVVAAACVCYYYDVIMLLSRYDICYTIAAVATGMDSPARTACWPMAIMVDLRLARLALRVIRRWHGTYGTSGLTTEQRDGKMKV